MRSRLSSMFLYIRAPGWPPSADPRARREGTAASVARPARHSSRPPRPARSPRNAPTPARRWCGQRSRPALARSGMPAIARLRVDNVVIGAVDEQEARPGLLVLIDRGVADRRSVEIGAAALHGRYPKEFLGDLVARTGDLVVVPLRLHVVDAVEADDRLHIGRGSGVRVTAILSRKQGFVACERNQRH